MAVFGSDFYQMPVICLNSYLHNSNLFSHDLMGDSPFYPLVNGGSEVKNVPRVGSAFHRVWTPPQVCLVPKALSSSVQFVQVNKRTVGT